MKKLFACSAAAIAALSLGHIASAAIIYSSPAATYSQNFDTGAQPDGSTGLPNNSQGQSPNASLGTTGNAVYGWRNDFGASTPGNWSIIGWHTLHPLNATEGGFNGNQRMRFGTGGSSTGSFYSFGNASGSTERALGMVNSNTMADPNSSTHPYGYFGAQLTNSTGSRLTEMSLSYYGEQWRDGGAAVPNAQSLLFEYSFDASSIQDLAATWHSVSALDFTSPVFVNTGSGAAVDGNAEPNRLLRSVANYDLFGSGWASGGALWLRWKDLNNSGNDHGLAIDDLQFSAEVPEPAGLALLLVALAGLAARRHARG